MEKIETYKRRIAAIDAAIDDIIERGELGENVTSYTVDNVSITKRDTVSLLTALERLKTSYLRAVRGENLRYVFEH